MKLRELFKFIESEQMVELVRDKWRITATVDALECCLNDEMLDGTVTSIRSDGSDLVVCVDCEDYD